MKPSARSHLRKGFTLVEVLTVIAIVSIILPGVMYGLSQASGIASASKQRSKAVEIAHNKLTELVVTGNWLMGDTQGDINDEPTVYHWQTQTKEWTESNLEELTVEVSWQLRGNTRKVSLTTLVTSTESQ